MGSSRLLQPERSFCPPQESGLGRGHFHEDNLVFTVMNLFAAGTDTSATTLRWGLVLMAKHPQIQSQSALRSCSVLDQVLSLLHLQARSRRS